MIIIINILTSATDMWLCSSLPIPKNRTLKTSEKYSKKFEELYIILIILSLILIRKNPGDKCKILKKKIEEY